MAARTGGILDAPAAVWEAVFQAVFGPFSAARNRLVRPDKKVVRPVSEVVRPDKTELRALFGGGLRQGCGCVAKPTPRTTLILAP